MNKIWTSDDSFAEHRLRSVLVALIVLILSTLALIVGPNSEDRLSVTWVTVFSAVFSVALVSVLYELVLRQSHAAALRRFIRLNSTVVGSGLQAIDEESDLDWRELLQACTQVTFVLVSPYRAVAYLNDVLRASKGRDVTIRFCLPDLPTEVTDPLEQQRASFVARAIGADERLASAVASTREDLVTTFVRESVHLGINSTLVVALYREPVFVEGAVLDDVTVLMTIDCGGRPRGAAAASFVFSGGHSPQVSRIRAGLLEVSDAAKAVESKDASRP